MHTVEIPITSEAEFKRVKSLLDSLTGFLPGEITTRPYLHIFASSERASQVLTALFPPDTEPVEQPVEPPIDPAPQKKIARRARQAPAASALGEAPETRQASESEQASCEGCGEPFTRTRKDQRFAPGHANCRNKTYRAEGDGRKPKKAAGVNGNGQAHPWKIESTGEEVGGKELSQRLTYGQLQIGEKVRHRVRGAYEVTAGRGNKYTLRRLES